MNKEAVKSTFQRGSGVLLHISSLPSDFGIGDLGDGAYHFVDFLHQAKQMYWQVLPLNPTDRVYGSSPYSSNSAFAISILFVSPQKMVEDGLLAQVDLAQPTKFSQNKVDYGAVADYKQKLLKVAFANFKKKKLLKKEFAGFCDEHKYWLDDYSLFLLIKEQRQGQIWAEWPESYRKRDAQVLQELTQDNSERIEGIKFAQFLVFRQWLALKKYCQTKGVRLIGDIPIYVTGDSADVWANPGAFKLNEKFEPIYVSGVPPDYFSETGQRWGTPVYNWDALKSSHYDWWVQRVRHNLKLFDIIRIDHFRGLIAFWQIPASEPTAIKGEWIPGPGDEFFHRLKEVFPQLPIIAEDLGIITPDVTEAMHRFGLPGMKILLFAFGGETATHPYIPENYSEYSVVYTGTHDNNTVKGWVDHDASEPEKTTLKNYLHQEIHSSELPWALIDLAMKSRADLAITPLQDLLALGQEARMNKPGVVEGNWQWRMEESSVTPQLATRLKELTLQSHRS